ncbi:MAG: ABC transporter permease [Acidimicrobiales bacterium]
MPESFDPTSPSAPRGDLASVDVDIPANSGSGGGSSAAAPIEDLDFRPPSAPEPITGPGRRSLVSQLDAGFWVAAGICVLWILASIFAGLLPLKNPSALDFSDLSGAINAAHPLGTDPTGRDTLSRVIFASRVSLTIGFVSVAAGLLVGGALGVICGYFRGWLDRVFTILTNVFLSFPLLVLAIVLVTFLGHNEWTIVAIIAIVAWPLLFRVVRAATIEYSQREYVLAAQALGSKPTRILQTLIIPDVIPSAITYGLLGVPLAIVAEGALSFLGQSVPTTTPTWGNMIEEGFDNIHGYTTLMIVASVAMFSFILPINYVGDKLRQVLDVRQGAI